jgi:hypothetical protein
MSTTVIPEDSEYDYTDNNDDDDKNNDDRQGGERRSLFATVCG